MSSDVSGEITAIATAVLAAFAIIAAAVAYMAYRWQTKEVTILQQQMKEQQDVLAREARDRHRAQASRVFLSLAYDHEQLARFAATNTSDQPVYDAAIRWRTSEVPTPHIRQDHLGTILPGDKPAIHCQPEQGNPHTLPDRNDPFTVLIFRDAAGVMWTRSLDGDLSEQGTPDLDQQTAK